MPIIKCKMEDGSDGYKVENTDGCPHKTREAAQKQLQAIKINKSKGEIKVTTVSEDHLHTYSGGERTSTDNGHSHRVVGGQILEANGHKHEFRKK